MEKVVVMVSGVVSEESFLVCCMFEEAVSLASSILRHICNSDAPIDEIQLEDMMESSGMILVQSLKELGRTPEMLNELKFLFGSVTAIPVQVVLTGACFQISESSCSGLQEFLSEFLSNWRYVDGQAGQFGDHYERYDGHSVLGVDKYLEVVEVYTITLLGMVLNEKDVAISWLEKAELPEEKRQELLRRLCSLYSPSATKSSRAVDSLSLSEVNKAHAAFVKERSISEVDESLRSSKAGYSSDGMIGRKQGQAILKLSERMHQCFWWSRTVNLKFGNARLVLTHGKIVLWSSLIVVIYYVLRQKRVTLRRIASRKVSSVKKALVDMWQLAFSVQVNPLAAVQPLPVAARGSR
ncbi:protein APEM9 isoform X2 [Telopea speciosissima]|uniref:protein APEM9 isoform X2 n=1 Tax=Telopea speciosissima TaxID=54955 RepID=UPI001CC7C87E|nr:protein APEM9 isoform X2 [Telopea speciosissima]XP_043711776.1 protein APEM9 isoform X2 [Telopea speciosissima]